MGVRWICDIFPVYTTDLEIAVNVKRKMKRLLHFVAFLKIYQCFEYLIVWNPTVIGDGAMQFLENKQ
jgi:hypothetical protein